MNPSRGLLLSLIGVLLLLSLAFVLPFLDYFLLAVLLAYLLSPVQDQFEPRAGSTVTAAGLALATTVALVLPLVLLIRITAADAIALLRQVREGNLTLSAFEGVIRNYTGIDVDLTGALQSAIRGVGVGEVGNVVGTVTHVAIGLGLTLFLLYYFLKDSDRFGRWLRRTIPFPDRVQDRLYDEIDGIMRAVIVGHLFVAIVQGVLAGIGLFVLGVPNATLWTVVMVVLSLLPVVGSFLVWGPAVVYLLGNGRPFAAAFLFAYGTIVVGVSDDYLRPIVVDRYAELNPAVIILGILGGIYVIGFMGIFFGPIVIGSLRVTLDVYRREYGSADRR